MSWYAAPGWTRPKPPSPSGSTAQASSWPRQVVEADPYREAAWRLLMRLAHTLGDHDRVIAAYRSCERALAELGAEPSPTTDGAAARLTGAEAAISPSFTPCATMDPSGARTPGCSGQWHVSWAEGIR